MASNALSLETEMLPPLVLRPPLGPWLLRAVVLFLALVFHPLTAGWTLISNGREGDLASAALEMTQTLQWWPASTEAPTGPLPVWFAKSAISFLGMEEWAARLPNALAAVALIWFTLRAGEQLGKVWREFSASMILLCSPGMFTLARSLSPAPLESALGMAAFYSLLCGYYRRKERRQWFFLTSLALSLLFFTGGWKALAVPLLALLGSLLFYRKARLRFRAFLSWETGLVLLASAGFAWLIGFHGFFDATSIPPTSALQILAAQPGLLFPWSLLLIPALVHLLYRLCARRPLEWEEAFPLLWAGGGFLVTLLTPSGSLFDTMLLWPAIALWAAQKFEVTPRSGLLKAIAAVFLLAILSLSLSGFLKPILSKAFPAMNDFIFAVPPYLWASVASVIISSLLAFLLFTGAAFVLEYQHQRRFTFLAFVCAMIPLGYAFADASAKLTPFVSFAEIARCVNTEGSKGDRVVVQESRFASSSLRFYLHPRFEIEEIGDNGSPSKVWERATYVITRRAKLPLWEPLLEAHHASITCESGGNLLLSREVKETLSP